MPSAANSSLINSGTLRPHSAYRISGRDQECLSGNWTRGSVNSTGACGSKRRTDTLGMFGAWLSLARAPGSGPGGRWFESTRPDQILPSICVSLRGLPHQMYGSMNGTTARTRFSSPLLNSNASRCPYFSVASSLRSLADVGIELRHRLRVEMCKFPLVRAYSRREIGSANASRPQLVYLL